MARYNRRHRYAVQTANDSGCPGADPENRTLKADLSYLSVTPGLDSLANAIQQALTAAVDLVFINVDRLMSGRQRGRSHG
jgi:hypothetical protein